MKHDTEDEGIKAARRKIQKDIRISGLIDQSTKIKVSSKLDSELTKYFVTSRDMVSGAFSYSGVSAGFNNPRKNLERIAQVLLDIQAYRDRVVFLQFSLHEHSTFLTRAQRVIENVIRERYSITLKKRGSLSLQDKFIDSCLEPVVEKFEQIDMYLKRCDTILKNLDKSYFTFTGIKQIGEEVISRVEGGKFSNAKMA